MKMRGIIPTRAVIGMMMFLACAISYMTRVTISFNLIAMVDVVKPKSSSSHVSECLAINDNVTRSNSTNDTELPEKLRDTSDFGPRYNWDSKVQGFILGAYFYGYIVTSMPGGLIAEHFGPRQVIGITTILSGVFNILIPLGASWHYGFVIAFRAILGLLGGVVYPSLHCLVAKWAPPTEKGKFVATLTGGSLGTVLTWPMLGAIIKSLGWYWSFFVPGIICIVWCISWYFLVSDAPEEHKSISEDEKIFITKATAGSVQKTKGIPPYKSIFLSLPFWALTVSHFGSLWGLYLLLTGGPKFVSEVLGFKLEHSGFLAALPYLARLIFGFVFGAVGDFIRKRELMSVTCIRKMFMLFSHFLPAVFLASISFVGCDSLLAITCLTVALGMNGAASITNLQNSQDLAPNYAGTLYGMINCIGGVSGFITPLVTGLITEENNGLKEWHTIFWIGAAIYSGCGVFFLVCGSGAVQPWNKVEEEKRADDGVVGIENAAFDNGTDVRESN